MITGMLPSAALGAAAGFGKVAYDFAVPALVNHFYAPLTDELLEAQLIAAMNNTSLMDHVKPAYHKWELSRDQLETVMTRGAVLSEQLGDMFKVLDEEKSAVNTLQIQRRKELKVLGEKAMANEKLALLLDNTVTDEWNDVYKKWAPVWTELVKRFPLLRDAPHASPRTHNDTRAEVDDLQAGTAILELFIRGSLTDLMSAVNGTATIKQAVASMSTHQSHLVHPQMNPAFNKGGELDRALVYEIKINESIFAGLKQWTSSRQKEIVIFMSGMDWPVIPAGLSPAEVTVQLNLLLQQAQKQSSEVRENAADFSRRLCASSVIQLTDVMLRVRDGAAGMVHIDGWNSIILPTASIYKLALEAANIMVPDNYQSLSARLLNATKFLAGATQATQEKSPWIKAKVPLSRGN